MVSFRAGSCCVLPGSVCTANGCVHPDQLAACNGIADGGTCSTPAFSSGVCVGGVCLPLTCGDRVIVGPEVCDDGNQRSADGCSADCLSIEVCGNNYVDAVDGEQCDEGLAGLSHDGCTSACTVELASWFAVEPPTPVARSEHAIAFDSHRKRLVLYGGSSAVTMLGDTMEWDGQAWRSYKPSVTPGPRVRHAMAFDAVRNVTVLFGGGEGTWEWDGIEWTRRTASPEPPARSNAALAFDEARGNIVLFGGEGYGDTWTWDGTSWTQHVVTPSPPLGQVWLAYDKPRTRVIAFTPTNQTWAWDGSAWTLLTSTFPSAPRTETALASTSSGVVLYAGKVTVLDSGTYLFTTSWTAVSPSPNPGSRGGHAMAYDSVRNRTITFAGATDTSLGGDLWEWSGSAWQGITPTTKPDPPTYSALAYSPRDGKTLFLTAEAGPVTVQWQWDGLAWNRPLLTLPPPRTRHTMVTMRDRVMLFGGVTNGFMLLNDTWTWDGTAWMMHSPTTKPSPRFSMALAYDSGRDRVVGFGGQTGTPSNETWEWNGTDWMLKTPAHTPPTVFPYFSFVYDATRGVSVLVGAGDNVWEWDGTDWVEIDAPVTLTAIGLAYDARRGRVMLVAESAQAGIFDTYEWTGDTWQPLEVVVAPLAVTDAMLAYDRARGELVMIGNDSFDLRMSIHRFASQAHPPDRCIDTDTDGDGLVGCTDPDCWGRCWPTCPLSASCDPTAPRCGDQVCSALEDRRLCPADCQP